MLSGLPLFVWRARACDFGNGSRTSQAGVSLVIGAGATIAVDCTTARERTATGQATESPKLQGAHHFDRRLVRREMKVGCRLGGCLADGNFCQCGCKCGGDRRFPFVGSVHVAAFSVRSHARPIEQLHPAVGTTSITRQVLISQKRPIALVHFGSPAISITSKTENRV